ncbi:MAG: hypothetical protein WBB08_04445 [Halobacteriota archaeon]
MSTIKYFITYILNFIAEGIKKRNTRNIKKRQVALLLSIFTMAILVSTAGFVVAEREGQSEQTS